MLFELLLRVAAFVLLAVPVSLVVFAGPERLRDTRQAWRSRLRQAAPLIAVLAVVLVLNRWMRQSAPAISQTYGLHLTETFYSIEGDFILVFQSIASQHATTYFSLVYVYGYTFLLVFPVVAYFLLDDTEPFRGLLAAYAINYAVGVVLYILVVAYGPRNVMLAGLETVLYDTRPSYQYLTQEVNRNTNVFPSLHTSLSATVAVFAYRTRREYRAWFPVAVLLAVSVIVSTMYLGLHWGIDVLGGLLLAVGSVQGSRLLVERWAVGDRVSGHVGGARDG